MSPPHPPATLPLPRAAHAHASRASQVQPRRHPGRTPGLCFRCAAVPSPLAICSTAPRVSLSGLRGYPVKQHKHVVAAKGPDTEASPPREPASRACSPHPLLPRRAAPTLPQASPPIGPWVRPGNGATCGPPSSPAEAPLRPAATQRSPVSPSMLGRSGGAQWMTLKHVSLMWLAPRCARFPARSTQGLDYASRPPLLPSPSRARSLQLFAPPKRRPHNRFRNGPLD